MIILGINIGHDSSAALVKDGKIVANVAEERFSRIKHDGSFPFEAIQYCLKEGAITTEEIDVVAIPGMNPRFEIDRFFLLNEQHKSELRKRRPFRTRIKKKLLDKQQQELPIYIERFRLSESCRLVIVEHHLAHAASAYFTRGSVEPCLIVTMDGVGDGVSTAVWKGQDNRITLLKKWGCESSLAWFYSNVTEALGWWHGDGEGTTMGLAPYGQPEKVGLRLDSYHPIFKNGDLIKPHHFGKVELFLNHGANHWHLPESSLIHPLVDEVGREHVAARAQEIIEQQIIPFITHWLSKTNTKNLVCSGGLFLNIKLNQRIWCELNLEEHWIYPDPGDSGLAIGAAIYAFYSGSSSQLRERLEHLYYGPSYSNEEIKSLLESRRLIYKYVDDPSLEAARLLADNKIIGWFQGRMEAGPRALGNRSILMSANRQENKDIINAKVKYREAFRPFCPSILHDKKDEYLVNNRDENFMITSFEVQSDKRDKVPAVVHQDGTLRPQTVKYETNPRYYDLIRHFGDLTGEYLVLNTSFNIKGEPIVCHPREAIRCFYDTGIDALILGNFLLEK
jgi:carbamoyltransferase